MSNQYKVIFFIRFLGYLLFFSGLMGAIFILGPVISAEAKYMLDRIFGAPRIYTGGAAGFAEVEAKENIIVPVSTEYGVVIEKINANARVIEGVNPVKEAEYVKALTQGVAEALGSTKPGQPGNLYLFSHSTDAPWNIIRLNAIFYLLRELEKGDRVVIFYQNRRYDYIVFDKTIAKPENVSYLTNKYDEPVLTLQTCDPPGTLLNRLVVRAKLVSS